MARIIIPKENFPDPSIYNPSYQIRFRLLAENKNRTSAWSPIFPVNPEVFFERGTRELRGYIEIEKVGSKQVNIVWDFVTGYRDSGTEILDVGKVQEYDLWIRWAVAGGATPSEWIYRGRISSTSLNITIPSEYPYKDPITGIITLIDNPKYLYAEVYRPSREITRYEQTATFPQNASTVDISSDTFIFPQGHGSSTGTPGLYTSTTPVGGLTSGVTYYTRTIDYYKISLYPTLADAMAYTETNKINLTGTPAGYGSFTGYPLRMYNDLITTL